MVVSSFQGGQYISTAVEQSNVEAWFKLFYIRCDNYLKTSFIIRYVQIGNFIDNNTVVRYAVFKGKNAKYLMDGV